MSEITGWLTQHYPETREGKTISSHLEELWTKFHPYADTNFIEELESSDSGKFHQRYWEMFLGAWLIDMGFQLLPHNNEGPDIAIQLNDRKVFFEAIVPGPGDGPDKVPELIPQVWEPGVKLEAKDVPSNQILMRWTSAFHTKAQQFRKYIDSGIVSGKDSCVIAINSCLLGHFGFDGISSFPAALEAVYPIGPQQVHFTQNQPEKTTVDLQHRPSVEKSNKSPIKTTPFMSDEFGFISALIATHKSDAHMFCYPGRPVALIHNLHAAVPIARKQIPADYEYWAEPINGGLRMRQDPERNG